MKSALFKQLLLFLVWPDVKDELLDITTLDFFLKRRKKKQPIREVHLYQMTERETNRQQSDGCPVSTKLSRCF